MRPPPERGSNVPVLVLLLVTIVVAVLICTGLWHAAFFTAAV